MSKSGFKKSKTITEDTSAIEQKSLHNEKAFISNNTKNKLDDTEDKSDTFRKSRMDALTERLGCTSYFHKMRWPWFKFEYGGVMYPLEIDRYYQEIKLAIDIGKVNESMKKYKEEVLKENNIKYIIIESATDMKNLALGLS